VFQLWSKISECAKQAAEPPQRLWWCEPEGRPLLPRLAVVAACSVLADAPRGVWMMPRGTRGVSSIASHVKIKQFLTPGQLDFIPLSP